MRLFIKGRLKGLRPFKKLFFPLSLKGEGGLSGFPEKSKIFLGALRG